MECVPVLCSYNVMFDIVRLYFGEGSDVAQGHAAEGRGATWGTSPRILTAAAAAASVQRPGPSLLSTYFDTRSRSSVS